MSRIRSLEIQTLRLHERRDDILWTILRRRCGLHSLMLRMNVLARHSLAGRRRSGGLPCRRSRRRRCGLHRAVIGFILIFVTAARGTLLRSSVCRPAGVPVTISGGGFRREIFGSTGPGRATSPGLGKGRCHGDYEQHRKNLNECGSFHISSFHETGT